MSAKEVTCRLCDKPAAPLLVETGGRRYHRCRTCDLIFVASDQLPDRDLEARTYRLHQNDPCDPRYRAFLARLLDPLALLLRPGMTGLDYGCGPGPTIRPMLAAHGIEVVDYDPIFRPDAAALDRSYDFITCSEVVEHFHVPGVEFARLDGLLRPGGRLAVMTGMVEDPARFAGWWYRRDPTHVAFYSAPAMRWIGQRFGYEVRFVGRTVTLFHKRAAEVRLDAPAP